MVILPRVYTLLLQRLGDTARCSIVSRSVILGRQQASYKYTVIFELVSFTRLYETIAYPFTIASDTLMKHDIRRGEVYTPNVTSQTSMVISSEVRAVIVVTEI
jgi:hypothetical protein